MFKIINKNIFINRGDSMTLTLMNNSDTFTAGSTIRFAICNVGDYSDVVYSKSFNITNTGVSIDLNFTPEEMRFSEPVLTGEKKYWYEIQLTNDSAQEFTLIGHDLNGDKYFTVWPEIVTSGEADE